jgi:hypothetical protein
MYVQSEDMVSSRNEVGSAESFLRKVRLCGDRISNRLLPHHIIYELYVVRRSLYLAISARTSCSA